MKIYETNEWKGHGKSYHWNEYYLNDNVVQKFKCSRIKSFDGKENVWSICKNLVSSWKIGVDIMPEWLSKFVEKIMDKKEK